MSDILQPPILADDPGWGVAPPPLPPATLPCYDPSCTAIPTAPPVAPTTTAPYVRPEPCPEPRLPDCGIVGDQPWSCETMTPMPLECGDARFTTTVGVTPTLPQTGPEHAAGLGAVGAVILACGVACRCLSRRPRTIAP